MKKFLGVSGICGMFLLMGLLLYHTQAQEAEPEEKILEIEIDAEPEAEVGRFLVRYPPLGLTKSMVYDKATDSVGIGTTSLSEKLTVAGIIHSTSGGIRFPDVTLQTTAAIDGDFWSLTGNPTTNPAINFLGTADNKPLEFQVNNIRALRLEPDPTSPNFIGGFKDNWITSGVHGATISGRELSGSENRVTDHGGTVGGGTKNQAGNDEGTTEDATFATVGGGCGNTANANQATVGGGYSNTASANQATVGGGYGNTASGNSATVGGGAHNEASGNQATIPGGRDNTASGIYSFAAGQRAKAIHNGTFVWGDSTDVDTDSTADNQFIVRAFGGTWIGSGTGTGVILPPNESAWVSQSDRSMKRNIRPVDGKDILSKLSHIHISRWSYKAQDPQIEHIGPMAQDFHAAFGLGEDDKHISTIDPDGVALAAIQGLYEMVQEKDAQIAAQQQQIAALESRLAALEALISSHAQEQQESGHGDKPVGNPR